MGILIQVKDNVALNLERAMRYRFWKKERERSNHAVAIGAGELRPYCPTGHSRIGWSGPPHDKEQAITCIDCGGYVTETEMKDRGFNFNDCPDWVFFAIMDEKRERVLVKGNPVLFVPHK